LSKKQLQEFINFHNSVVQFTKSFDRQTQIKEANTLAKNFITNLVDQEFDYFEFRNANSLEIEGNISEARLFYAIYKGQTRLIDNIEA
jgi:pantothenate synthetase